MNINKHAKVWLFYICFYVALLISGVAVLGLSIAIASAVSLSLSPETKDNIAMILVLSLGLGLAMIGSRVSSWAHQKGYDRVGE